jgi:RHS repeat-associated protein
MPFVRVRGGRLLVTGIVVLGLVAGAATVAVAASSGGLTRSVARGFRLSPSAGRHFKVTGSPGTRHARRSAVPGASPAARAQMARLLAKLAAAERARARILASPAMRAARARSDLAYTDASGVDPASLMSERFGKRLQRALATPAASIAHRVIAYHSDFVAVVKDAKGHAELADSSIALRSAVGSGQPAPVDLSLRPIAGWFAPQNPIVPVEFGQQLSQGLQIGAQQGTAALATRTVGLFPETTGSGVILGTAADGGVLYRDVATDTDLEAAATSQGFEFFEQLRSRRAPEEISYRVALPAGAVLQPEPGGGVAVVKAGATLVVIRPPVAADGQGKSVPASLQILDPSHIAVTVAHRSADVAYPILVDPLVQGQGGNTWLYGNSLQGLADWDPLTYDFNTGASSYQAASGLDGFYPVQQCNPYLDQASSCYDGPSTQGLQVYQAAPPLATNDFAYSEWDFQTAGHVSDPAAATRRTTYIPEFDLYDAILNYHTNPPTSPGTQSAYLDALIWDVCDQTYAASQLITAYSSNPAQYQAVQFFPEITIVDGSGASPGANPACARLAGFAMNTQPQSAGSRTDWVDGYLGGAVVYLEDPEPATFGQITHSNAAVQYGGWDDPTAGGTQAADTVTANVMDAGLGVQTTGLYPANAPAGSQALEQLAAEQPVGPDTSGASSAPSYWSAPLSRQNPLPTACSGLHDSLCPNSDTVNFAYSIPSNLPEGANQPLQELAVGDPLNAVGEANHGTISPTWSVNVDLDPPATTLSGSLWNGRTSALGSSTLTPLTNATYSLTVSSTDNYSGVAETDISIDGHTATATVYKNVCTSVQCDHAQTVAYTFDSEAYPPRQCANELPASAPTGCHTITVTTKDWLGTNDGLAGHDTTTSFDVYTNPPAVQQGGQQAVGQSSGLGLEKFWDFREFPTGGGSELRVNEGNGNLVWDSTPMVDPGQGLSTVVTLAYNSQHQLGDLDPLSGLPLLSNLEYDQIGQGFSLGIDGLTRLNEPLDLSQANIGGATPQISFTTVYGTRETFVANPTSPGQWIAPPGVFLHLRQYSALNSAGVPTDPQRAWAITRPDGVTFFFDTAGYESSIEDRTANTITFKRDYTILDTAPTTPPSCSAGDVAALPLFDATVCTERVYEVDDQNEPQREKLGEHKFTICYYDPNPATEDGGCSQTRDYTAAGTVDYLKVSSITDHAGRVLHLDYTAESVPGISAVDLTKITMNAQDNAASPQQQVFNLGYSQQGNPLSSLPLLGQLIPSGLLFPNGLSSVQDPNGNATLINYEAPTLLTAPCPNDQPGVLGSLVSVTGLEPKCAASIIERDGGETDFAYGKMTDQASGTADFGQVLHLTTVTGPRTVMQGTTSTRPDNWVDEIDGSLRPVIQENPVQTADTTGSHGLTSLTWGASGGSGNQLTSLIDAYGAPDQTTTLFQYDPNGRLTDRKGPSLSTDTNPRDVTISYQQSAGMLLAPSSLDKGATFVSDPTSMEDQNRNTYTFAVDPVPAAADGTARADGLVTAVSDQTGARWTTGYQTGPSGTVQDGGGLVTSQSTPGNPPQTFSSFEPNGLPQKETDPSTGATYADGKPIGGGTARYGYDAVGDLLTVTDPRNPTGTIGTPTCGASTTSVPAYTIAFHYDDLQRVTDECASKDSTASPTGTTSSFVHTSRTYDANGNQVSATDGNGNPTTYTPTPMDWLASQTTPKGEATTYIYDRNGDLIDVKQPLANGAGAIVSTLGVPSSENGQSTSPAPGVPTSTIGHETLYAYDGAGDQLAADELNPGSTAVDPDHVTTYSYNDRGDQTGVADPVSNAAVAKTTVGEQITPAQLAQAIANANVGTNPLAPSGTSWRTATAYNATGAPVQITTNPGSVDGSKFFTVQRRQYDADGNLLADQDPRYTGATPSADGLGGFDLSDGHGNPIAKNISAEGYDSRSLLTLQTDSAGNETLYGRGPDGKICWMMAPNGVAYQQSQNTNLPSSSDCTSATQALPYTTGYTYNAPGWLATVALPKAQHEYGYGKDTMTVSYERNQAGNPIDITDARGSTFNNTFYDNGELKTTSHPSWWTYDPQGTGMPGPDPNTGTQGDVSSDTPGAGLAIREKTLQEQYQAASQAQTSSPLPQTSAQGDYGAVSTEAPAALLPAAGTTTFGYDGDGSLTSVSNAQSATPASLSYNGDEQLSGISLPCGCVDARATYPTSNTSYTYDADRNLQTVTTPPVEGTSGDSPPTTTYTYDALDRQIRQTAPGGDAGPKPYSPVVGPYQNAVTYTSYALAPSVPAVPGSGYGSATSFNVAEQVSVTDPRGATKADAGATECPSNVNPGDTTTACWGQGAGDASHTTISQYDALGNRVEQQSPLVVHSGQSTQQREATTYEYDQSGDQTRVVLPLGNQPFASGSGQDLHYATTNTYDPNGNVSSSVRQLASGTQVETDYSYDHDGNVSQVSRPAADSAGDPEVTMRSYNGRNLPWTTTTGVTPAGQATSVMRTTVSEYDGNGNLRRTVNPAGIAQTPNALGPADPSGQGGAYYPYESSSTDPGYDNAPSPAGSEVGEPNANIDATIRVYNTDNLLTAVYQPWGCNLTPSGQPTKCTQITDQRRFRQLFARDTLGRVQTSTSSYDWSNHNAPQNATNYAYTDSGWVSTEVDPAVSPATGEATKYQYDPAGDQTSWQQSGTLKNSNGGNSYGQATTRAYYPDGEIAQSHANGLTGLLVEHTYSYYHLPTGELDYAQTDTASNSSAPGETQNLTYDDVGRLVAVNENIPPGAVQGGTPSPYDTTQAYDANGNLIQRRTNGSITPGSSLYAGGQTTTLAYDTLGRETAMTVAPNPATPGTTPDSCPAPTSAQPCRFFNTPSYTASGQVLKEQRWQGDPNNPSGQITENYTYNSDGTLLSDNRTGNADGTDNLNVTYSYDTDANRTADERGQHLFNALNQEVQWTRGGPDTQAPTSTVKYTLDGDGSLLQKIENTYTNAIPITPKQPGSPNATQDETFATTTQYCSQSTASLSNTATGTWQGCQHDAGRVERTTSAQTTTVTAVHNAAAGTKLPAPTTTYTTQDYCYDQTGQNRRITQDGNTTQAATSLPPANPTSTCPTDPLAQGLQTGETANTTTRYGYDSFGREVTSTGPDPASANPKSPTIDADTYSYDTLDRRYQKAETAVPPSGPQTSTTTNYNYIADSNQVSQDSNLNSSAQTVTDTYDYNSTGQRKGTNALAPNTKNVLTNTYHSYATDANGSVTALENSSGSAPTADRYHYDPYGNLELGAGALQTAITAGNFQTATSENQLAADAQANKYRFEGFYYDSGVATYDLLARPYRPDSGQFLVSDRFQDALGDQQLAADPLTQNRYAFAGGNPTSNVEYDGHAVCNDPGGVCHGGGAVTTICSTGGGPPCTPTGVDVTGHPLPPAVFRAQQEADQQQASTIRKAYVAAPVAQGQTVPHTVETPTWTPPGGCYSGQRVICNNPNNQTRSTGFINDLVTAATWAAHELSPNCSLGLVLQSCTTPLQQQGADLLNSPPGIAAQIIGLGGDNPEADFSGIRSAVKATLQALKRLGSSGAAAAEDAPDLLAQARAARDAKAAEVGSSKATVTGGYDPATGRVVAGCSSNPIGCAEDDVARQLGIPNDQIQFTEAIRPRTGEQVPVCGRCQTKYGSSQFPPDTLFGPPFGP